MSNREEEEFYRQKYLKYKTKYLEAKNEIEGGQPINKIKINLGNLGTCSKCDGYIYFLNTKDKNLPEIFKNNNKLLTVTNSGCDFDQEIFRLFGNFAYIEVRSSNLGKSIIKSIFSSKKPVIENENDNEFKKLNNATLIKIINGKYENGVSYRTSPKDGVSIINNENDDVKPELLNQINTELKTTEIQGFTHYFIKEYSCFLKGNTRISILKDYKA